MFHNLGQNYLKYGINVINFLEGPSLDNRIVAEIYLQYLHLNVTNDRKHFRWFYRQLPGVPKIMSKF